MVKLLVVEDHALVREGLVQTLRHVGRDTEVFEAADFDGATAVLEQQGELDLMLLDLGLPGLDGLSCLRAFRQRYPEIPVIILSGYDDSHTVNRAMKCGAAAFVSKADPSERLLQVVSEVLAGRVFDRDMLRVRSAAVSPHPPAKSKADPANFGLSERQAEVLGLMVRGKSNRDIAGLLGLTEGTVKVHLTAIFKALGATSRTQAMVVVARRGIRV